MENSKFVTEWVIETVKEKYADDIALVVSHSTLRIDENEEVISYFVPITERGRTFARTFILDGEGFDIWGIEWERLEKFAALEEYNITCLADGEVLYARMPADKQRFEELKKIQLELQAFSPDKVVWDIDDLSNQPPWGKNISNDITNLSNYFVTSDGEDFITIFFNALEKAKKMQIDLTIENV